MHLCEVYEEYEVVSNGSTIEQAIKKEMSGDTERTFLAIGKQTKTSTFNDFLPPLVTLFKIRECGSTLYVGLAKTKLPTNKYFNPLFLGTGASTH